MLSETPTIPDKYYNIHSNCLGKSSPRGLDPIRVFHLTGREVHLGFQLMVSDTKPGLYRPSRTGFAPPCSNDMLQELF